MTYSIDFRSKFKAQTHTHMHAQRTFRKSGFRLRSKGRSRKRDEEERRDKVRGRGMTDRQTDDAECGERRQTVDSVQKEGMRQQERERQLVKDDSRRRNG